MKFTSWKHLVSRVVCGILCFPRLCCFELVYCFHGYYFIIVIQNTLFISRLQKCSWIIMTNNSSHAITFKMTKLIAHKAPYCGEDFVLVRDGKLYMYLLASLDDKVLTDTAVVWLNGTTTCISNYGRHFLMLKTIINGPYFHSCYERKYKCIRSDFKISTNSDFEWIIYWGKAKMSKMHSLNLNWIIFQSK